MEKETVLEIEFKELWDNNFAWKIVKQNEEILKRNEFLDKELNVESFRSPEFFSLANKLFIKGSAKSRDDNISICNQEEKALIEEKVKAINEKYGIKRRWRAEDDEVYYYINEHFEVDWFRDNRMPGTNKNHENGNYFQTKQEALEYAVYIKKCSLEWHEKRGDTYSNSKSISIRRKSKMMIPEKIAIAMIEKGWILRNEIIWHKSNVVPEAVQDRFTNDFEKIYFFTKSEKYFFEKQYEAFSEKTLTAFKDGIIPTGKKKMLGAGESRTGMREVNKPWKAAYNEKGRNMRTVWKIATKGISEAHFATFPKELVKRCILAGCPESGIVLDPFLGSGTTLKVAKQLNRSGIGIELNQEYIQIAKKRIGNDLFNEVQVR